MNIEPIATFHSPFRSKFGIPRQSGLVPSAEGTIVFEKKYRNPDALRGLSGFSHLWLIWGFSANRPVNAHDGISDWEPTVRPPRLGGNISMGVFATRSPFRPNGLGLSSVEISSIELDTPEGPVIHVRGADLMDTTPVFDIKPYISYSDSHPQARCGFASQAPSRKLNVVFNVKTADVFSQMQLETLTEALSLDPRPAYQEEPSKVYGMLFEDHDVHFMVSGDVLTVTSVD